LLWGSGSRRWREIAERAAAEARCGRRVGLLVTPKFSTIFPKEVKTGEELTIKGENLIEIQQVIFPDNVFIDAMHFKRKSDTEIIVVVPSGTIDGEGTLQIVALSGDIITTSPFSIEVTDEPIEEGKWIPSHQTP